MFVTVTEAETATKKWGGSCSNKFGTKGRVYVHEVYIPSKGERAPGTHCLHMCVIIGKTTW